MKFISVSEVVDRMVQDLENDPHAEEVRKSIEILKAAAVEIRAIEKPSMRAFVKGNFPKQK